MTKPDLAAANEMVTINLAQQVCGRTLSLCGHTEAPMSLIQEYFPHPSRFIDGEASEADLKKFFLATLKGAVKMLEEPK